jgi:hypothetical protein
VFCLVFRRLTSQKRQVLKFPSQKWIFLLLFCLCSPLLVSLVSFFPSYLFMFIYTFGHLQCPPLENGECEDDEQKITADSALFQAFSSLVKLSS